MGELMLDARLAALAEMVPPCRMVADIGCDHGRLGAFLLQTGQCERVQFLDISPDSLGKARRLTERLGLTDRAVFSVGDGARALLEPADCVVIAGMGGQAMAAIVERGADKFCPSRLILQPNVAQAELRGGLMRAGFFIEEEKIVRAAGRRYVVISAARGNAFYDKRQLLVGPKLLERGDPGLADYARWRLSILQKALAGAASRSDDRHVGMRWEYDVWKELERGGNGTKNL